MADGRKAIDREIEDDDLSTGTETNQVHDIDVLNTAQIRGTNPRTLAAVMSQAWLFRNLTSMVAIWLMRCCRSTTARIASCRISLQSLIIVINCHHRIARWRWMLPPELFAAAERWMSFWNPV
jgi:hypothetical protein